MRNSLKVAKWEIKRNLTNKSFIIGLFSTPLIFLAFLFIPMFFDRSDTLVNDEVTIYVKDELGIMNELENVLASSKFSNWTLKQTEMSEAKIEENLLTMERSAYLIITEDVFENGQVNLHRTEDLDDSFPFEITIFEQSLRKLQMETLGLTNLQQTVLSNQVAITPVEMKATEIENAANKADPLKRMIPGVFAGVILFSIVITGMMIFQSASQEKKEKVAEIILSSLTPSELMQGKIIGYFVLGITQVIVWLIFAVPAMMWRFDMPFIDYLFVPEMFILLLIALAGYLLFAAIFVGIGATVEDINGTSNFQAIVMMLPFAPIIFISSILSDPSGLIAKIGSFIPITAPAVWIMRLSILEEWPWVELCIGGGILLVSIWLFMKLAGKIFNIGIMMYGKNATPKEIWKWMWA